MSMTCGQIFMLVIQNTDLHCNISKKDTKTLIIHRQMRKKQTMILTLLLRSFQDNIRTKNTMAIPIHITKTWT